ncbi:MAG TPA: hypothetical protein ENF49_02875 [Candidatus Altiarchaeales archaeon]|nr:hypothetical protein [Candidatus Altiarchaeales archaeon]HEX55052.1 hypothetical protein [Candidatus Altiarchaeales archaeon]
MKWKYSMEDDITAIYAGSLNDGVSIITASSNGVYIIDPSGNLIKEYSINFEDNSERIHLIRVFDLDGDDRDEILLGSGWMKTVDVEYEYVEEVDLLYRKHEGDGNLYIIDDDEIESIEIDNWVREIEFTDIDGDGEKEIIVVSGSYGRNFYKKYTDIPYVVEYCWYENYTKYAGDYNETECNDSCPTCFWDYENDRCLKIVQKEVCDTNITTRKGWNFTEYPSRSGSLKIFDKDYNIKVENESDRLFLSATICNLYHDLDSEFIIGSEGKIHIISQDLVILHEYSAPGDIERIFSVDVDDDGNYDFIFSFLVTEGVTTGVSGIMAIDREGNEIWQETFDEEISDVVLELHNESVFNKIIVASGELLYFLDIHGNILRDSTLRDGYKKLNNVRNINSIDVDDDGYNEIILSCGNALYLYALPSEFTSRENADRFYELAEDYYNSEDIKNALLYLNKSMQIYMEIEDDEGVKRCKELLDRIQSKIIEEKKEEGDSHYSKALIHYAHGEYESAKMELETAREIYYGIGYSDGVLRCNALMKKINEKLKTTTTTTTISEVTTSTTTSTTLQSMINSSVIKNVLSIIGGVLIVIIILFITFKSVKRREEGEVEKVKEMEEEVEKEVEEEEGEGVEEEKGMEEERKKERRERILRGWELVEDEWKKLEEL